MKSGFFRSITSLAISVLLPSICLAAIHGIDNRQDINMTPWLREEARAVAIAIDLNFLRQNSNGTYRIHEPELLGGSSSLNVCKDERFARQTTIGNCTGFLLTDLHLITGGHCLLPTGIATEIVKNAYCKAFAWKIDYNLASDPKMDVLNIAHEKIYRCKRVIRAENIELPGPVATRFGNDFAVIELDRPVPSSVKPLKIAAAKPKNGEYVFTIGHPSGLPAKYSGYSKVEDVGSDFYFRSDLDTLGGNSGGPVFNTAREVVGILVSGHPLDYVDDPRTGCRRLNFCNAGGSRCLIQSKFPGQQTSNYIQYVDAVIPWLPLASKQ